MPQQCIDKTNDPCLSRWKVNWEWGYDVFHGGNASDVIEYAALTIIETTSETFRKAASHVLNKFARQYPDAAKIAVEKLEGRVRAAQSGNDPGTSESAAILEIQKSLKN